MSRIGRKPVEIPDKVKIDNLGEAIAVAGPLGQLRMTIPEGVTVSIEDGVLSVHPPKPTRANRGFQGLTRALIANMVEGVTKGYEKSLEINGVGYKAELEGKDLTLSVGYSHQVKMTLPDGIEAEVNKPQTLLKLKGIDKQLVGQVAAKIRATKLAEPYKGKGIKYVDETIRRKVGKAGTK